MHNLATKFGSNTKIKKVNIKLNDSTTICTHILINNAKMDVLDELIRMNEIKFFAFVLKNRI